MPLADYHAAKSTSVMELMLKSSVIVCDLSYLQLFKTDACRNVLSASCTH